MLARQASLSGLLLVGTRIITRCADLIALVVLGKFLAAAQFGIASLALSIVMLVEAVLDLPISLALVRLQHIDDDDLGTAFTISMLRGLAVMAILAGLAGPIAAFYHRPELFPLILALSIAPAARGLVSPNIALFNKNLSVWRNVAADLAGKFMGLIVVIIFAVAWRNYWAIALGSIVSPLVTTIASYILAPFRSCLTLKKWRYFSHFFGWTTAGQVLSALNWQLDKLILGKFLGPTQFGFFSIANDISSIPLRAVLNPIVLPLTAAFTQGRGGTAVLARRYSASAAAILAISLPIVATQALCSPVILQVIFGPQWNPAAPILRLLCLSLIPALFAAPFGALVIAVGRPDLGTQRNAVEMAVRLPLLVPAIMGYAVNGAIAVRVIAEIAAAIFCFALATRLVGDNWIRQLRAYVRPTLAAAAAYAAFATPAAARLIHSVNSFYGLAAVGVSYALTYAVLILLLWRFADCPDGPERILLGVLHRIRAPVPKETGQT